MLEKILEEIEKEIRNQKTIWKSLKKPPYNDFEQTLWIAGMRNAKDIIRKHINAGKDINVPAKDGWIPVEDQDRMPKHIWDIYRMLNAAAGVSGMEIIGLRDKETGKEYRR